MLAQGRKPNWFWCRNWRFAQISSIETREQLTQKILLCWFRFLFRDLWYPLLDSLNFDTGMYVVRSCRIGGTSIPSSRCKSKKVVSLKDKHIHQPQTCWTLKNPMNVSHLGATSKRWCWTHGSLRPFCGVKEVNYHHLTQPPSGVIFVGKNTNKCYSLWSICLVLLNKTWSSF